MSQQIHHLGSIYETVDAASPGDQYIKSLLTNIVNNVENAEPGSCQCTCFRRAAAEIMHRYRLVICGTAYEIAEISLTYFIRHAMLIHFATGTVNRQRPDRGTGIVWERVGAAVLEKG